MEGLVRFNEKFELVLEEKMKRKEESVLDKEVIEEKSNKLTCPQCKKGTVIKGKSAYGCSEYKSGCDFRYNFEDIRKKAMGKELSKELVYNILNGKI